MVAKTWESDFRWAAITASIRKFGDEIPDDIFHLRESFCLPVAERPIVGFSPGKVMLIALVLGFALLGGGAWIASTLDEGANDPRSALVLAVAALSSLSGMAMFFLPTVFDRRLVSFFLRNRGRDLLHRTGDGTLLTAEISNADDSAMKISIDGDDHALIWADRTSRRLIIEGVAARYHICEEDVVRIAPFVFVNYVGADISYRIDDDIVLRIAIARVSSLLELTRQLPFLAFLRKRIRNRVLDEVTASVGEMV